jgi:hypothetical protein
VRVELERRIGTEKPFQFPSKCPVCRGEVARDGGSLFFSILQPGAGRRLGFCPRPLWTSRALGPHDRSARGQGNRQSLTDL